MSYITFLTNALPSKSGNAGYVNLPGFWIIASFNVSVSSIFWDTLPAFLITTNSALPHGASNPSTDVPKSVFIVSEFLSI